MVRLNSDGSLDATFGSGGKVSTSFTNGDDIGRTIVLQPDGKIILAGYINNGNLDFAMARYTSSGALDNSFSSDGILYTDFNFSVDKCNAIALQPDGKIIVAGESTGQGSIEFAQIRYNSDGSIDSTYGADGKVYTSFGGTTSSRITSLILQTDGKIIAAGETFETGNLSKYALARYNIDGSLDNSFSIDGIVTTDLGDESKSIIYSLALQPNGYIVAAGYSVVNGNYYMAFCRYKTDGTLDTDFDGDGKLTSEIFSYVGQARSVLLQSDGKILGAGYGDNGNNFGFGLIRLNIDGSIDNTFGTSGTVITNFNSNDAIAYSAAIQPNLRIVLAGFKSDGTFNYDFAIARYLSGLNLGLLEFSSTPTAYIYPNPLGNTNLLSFELSKSDILSINIYDILGRKIKTIVENQYYSDGKHQINIDASTLISGVYKLIISNQIEKTVIDIQK